MAKLLKAFDANQYDPTQGAGSLPIGRHPVIIVDSSVEATKGNDGGYLLLTLKICDGPQTGTTGPYRLNLYNASPAAQEIAHRQMSAVCHCIGVFNVEDTTVMHNRPFMVDVGFQKGQEPGSGPDAKGYTEVKKVFDQHGNEPGKKGAQQQGNNSAGQFDNQMANFQQKQEAQGPAGNTGGNGGAWGNNGGNSGGNSGGNNQNTQQNQSGGGWNAGGNNSGSNGGAQNTGGSNGGGGWNNGNQGNNGGGGWQQNQGGNANGGGWQQRN